MKGRIRCREEEKLQPLPQEEYERALSYDSYGTYIHVQAVAQALHASLSSRSQRRLMVEEGEQWGPQRLQPWQLHPFLREIRCLNTSRGRLCLDENWELPADFDILNWVMSPNKSCDLVKIGNIRRETSAGIKFTINPGAIEWNKEFNKVGGITEGEGHQIFIMFFLKQPLKNDHIRLTNGVLTVDNSCNHQSFPQQLR
ncbi:extracellular calcium-sensing receptor-like [Podarcis raffonei]|uniref:extracellular calcium-sensing receptor-like n=1 Tax=Podarcis raffonei TaxID=65483 RepID=UPI0023295EAC|nr:extracellular calcium-sensing receptor-like [Podarcis raffonei]